MLVNACHIAVCKWKGSAKFGRSKFMSKLSSSKKKKPKSIQNCFSNSSLTSYYIPTYHYNTMVLHTYIPLQYYGPE